MINRRNFLFSTAAGAGLLLPGSRQDVLLSLLLEDSDPVWGKGTRIEITPDEVWREKETSVEIRITLGSGGLPKTDSFGLVSGSCLDRWKFNFPSHHWGGESPWQTTDVGAPGHISASCSREEASVKACVGTSGGAKPYCNRPGHFVRSLKERMRFVLEISADRDLKEGDVLRIRWERVIPPPYAVNCLFLPFRFSLLTRDRNLPNRRGAFDLLPAIRVKGRNARRLHVFAPGIVGAGEAFDLGLAAVDEYGNPAEDFEGEIQLACKTSGIAFPGNVRMSLQDRGRLRVKGIRAVDPGWFKIEATSGACFGKTNYVVVSKEPPCHRLYFGDMHSHTLDCDGTIDIKGHFDYGPSVAGLDFGAVSPHAEYFGHKDAWIRYLKETTLANKPGEFVTFYGYEWANEGHTNAYFLDEGEAALVYGSRMIGLGHDPDDPPFRIPCGKEGEFFRALRKLKRAVFCIAHCHTAYKKEVDDSVLWLDEIYSCHKRKREQREARLRKNLARGLHLGVVAGSDMHRMTIGHLCRQPGERWPQGGWEKCQFQTAGLQATFAERLDRSSLYEGMKARHTYGTSGARIVLFFEGEGKPMGSRLSLRKDAAPLFRIEVGATAAISEVALCRFDGKQWTESWKGEVDGTDRFSGEWREDILQGDAIYYIRVTQADGENAWSSPIWIVREG